MQNIDADEDEMQYQYDQVQEEIQQEMNRYMDEQEREEKKQYYEQIYREISMYYDNEDQHETERCQNIVISERSGDKLSNSFCLISSPETPGFLLTQPSVNSMSRENARFRISDDSAFSPYVEMEQERKRQKKTP